MVETKRRQSIVDMAEQRMGWDKQTIILVVNLCILLALISLLYMVANQALNFADSPLPAAASAKSEH